MTSDDENPRVASVHMREVGWEIRLARRRSNIKATIACDELGWSTSKLSKIERGHRRPSDWDAASLLGLCSVGRETHDRLRVLIGETDTGFFVRSHGDATPEALTVVAMHEAMATAVTTYGPTAMPSLVQSAGYARALLAAGLESAEGLDAAVEARMARREALLRGRTAPRVVVYLGEAALTGVVGSPGVMHDQLTALAMMVGTGLITLRVIPANTGHASVNHEGTHLELPNLPDVVYAEVDYLTVVYDEVDLVARWRNKENRLDELALTASESLDLLLTWVDFYDRPSALVDSFAPRPAAVKSGFENHSNG